MGKLTAKMVGQISDPGRYGDGAGLYLIVAPTGTKSWVQRVRIDGKATDKGLGGIAKVTLSTARKTAEANRTSLKRGHNPFTKTSPAVAIVDTPAEAKTIPTFGYAVQAVYEANREEWGDNTAKRWLARMVQHCEALDGREVDGKQRGGNWRTSSLPFAKNTMKPPVRSGKGCQRFFAGYAPMTTELTIRRMMRWESW
jgi:hypothetical protein